MLLMVLVLSGCSGSGEKLDLDIGPKAKTPEEIKAEGNPFVYYEYEGKEIPILTRPLMSNNDYYVTGHGKGTDLIQYEFVPSKYIFHSNVLSSIYGDIGDPEKHEPLVTYMEVIPDGDKREGRYEGYLKNSGQLFMDGSSSSDEDWSRDILIYRYCISRDEAYIGIDYSYMKDDGSDQELYLASYIFDTKNKQLIDQSVYQDTTSRFNPDGIPEYKNDVVKDTKEIRDDLTRMYCLDTRENFMNANRPIIGSECIMQEINRLFGFGFYEDPVSLYITSELAYIRDYDLEIEEHGGIFYTRRLSKDGNSLYFDEDWKLSSFENDEIQAEYVYGDNYVEINIKDLSSGKAETVKYDF